MKILQDAKTSIMGVVTKVTTAVGKVFDGLMASVNSLATKPIKLVGAFIVGLCAFDVFSKGQMGFITYLIGTFNAVVKSVQAIDVASLVVILLIVVFLNKNK